MLTIIFYYFLLFLGSGKLAQNLSPNISPGQITITVSPLYIEIETDLAESVIKVGFEGFGQGSQK